MSTLHPCAPVGLDFIAHAPFRFANAVDLAVTPEQLWEVLTDAAAWPRWATVITGVRWTSPAPYGVGTTRTVTMRGGLVGEEEFLAWEPGKQMAFRFNRASTRAITAFAELYEIVETADGCRLTWTLAQRPAGVSRLTMAPMRPLLNLVFRRYLSNLRRYTDERYDRG